MTANSQSSYAWILSCLTGSTTYYPFYSPLLWPSSFPSLGLDLSLETSISGSFSNSLYKWRFCNRILTGSSGFWSWRTWIALIIMHQARRNGSIIRQGMWANVGRTAHLEGEGHRRVHMKLSFHSDAGNTGDWWGQKRTESSFNRKLQLSLCHVAWASAKKHPFGYFNNIIYLNGVSPAPTHPH